MTKRITLSVLVTLVLGALGFYIAVPAIHIKSSQFWGFLLYLAIVFFVSFFFSSIFGALRKGKGNKPKTVHFSKKTKTVLATAAAVVLVAGIAIFVTSSQVCNAKQYQQMLTVKNGDFKADISEIKLSQVPVVDRGTATRLGSRKIGEVVELVSQFNVSDYYTQINYGGTPTRVSPLEYADLIKWFTNRKEGIPYYVKIDMATQNTDLVHLPQGMKYMPCELFGRNLTRHVRFAYPTKMIQSTTFEIDESGHPYWAVSYYDYTIGFLGGRDVVGIILVDAVTGEMKDYKVSEVPQWIDTVYDSEMLIEQADYWGTYTNGYFNSIFGQKNVIETTSGYNYIALNDDVWMYTGLTSVVDDDSIVGFLLVNLRTKESIRYDINGAEEMSAMSSAEGMIQEKGYVATFPILVNIENQPTYFVSLKDDAGLVKAYSFVSVSNYQIVGVADTIEGAVSEYKRLLFSAGANVDVSDTAPAKTEEKTIKVADIASAVVGGNTVYYIKAEDGTVYTAAITADSALAFVRVGDTLKFTVNAGERNILSVIR